MVDYNDINLDLRDNIKDVSWFVIIPGGSFDEFEYSIMFHKTIHELKRWLRHVVNFERCGIMQRGKMTVYRVVKIGLKNEKTGEN
jgi:hypothetical protein